MKQLLIPMFAILLMGCGSETKTADAEEQPNNTLVVGVADTAQSSLEVEEAAEAEIPEVAIANMTIKEAEQKSALTFCDCVKKNKKLEDQVADAEGDAFDALLEEMERLVKEECKILTSGEQTSPEAREERKQRVADCLN